MVTFNINAGMIKELFKQQNFFRLYIHQITTTNPYNEIKLFVFVFLVRIRVRKFKVHF